MTAFAPHTFPALIEEDLVVFDVSANRYLALPHVVVLEADRAVGAGWDEILIPEALEALRTAGLIVDSPKIAASFLPRPSTVADIAHGGFRFATIIDAAIVRRLVARTSRLLLDGLACRTFSPLRSVFDERSESDRDEALQRLQAARLVVSTPRRCLPSSFVAASFLTSIGFDCDIVFGVRSHPFGAHCWIERAGTVLDDELDRVRAFTPIAVGRP